MDMPGKQNSLEFLNADNAGSDCDVPSSSSLKIHIVDVLSTSVILVMADVVQAVPINIYNLGIVEAMQSIASSIS